MWKALLLRYLQVSVSKYFSGLHDEDAWPWRHLIGKITSSVFRKVSLSVLSDVFSDARSRSFLVPRDDDRGGSRRAQWVFPDPHVSLRARRKRSWANPRLHV